MTDGGTDTAVPIRAAWPSPAWTAICVAASAVAVAVNVTGLPWSVPDVAVKVFGPAALPRVQLVTAALPLALVVCEAPVTLPPPVPGANVTATPATGLANASRTTTAGGTVTAVPTVAVWPSPALLAIDAAAAAVTPTLAVAVTGVTPLRIALIGFVSALVELSVPVIWPFAPVGPLGWASALFAPVAARATVTPLTGLPNSSFAVTVIVPALAPVGAGGEPRRGRRQGVGARGGAQGPAPHGPDTAGVGRLARAGDAAGPGRDGEAHRHARHRVAARVFHDHGRRNRHG